MADIDKLQIEIEASSSQAEQQIRALNDELKALKSTLGGQWKNPVKDIQRGARGETTRQQPQQQQAEVSGTRHVESQTGEAELDNATRKALTLREVFKSFSAVGSSVKKAFTGVFSGLANSAKQAIKPLANLASSFKRILFYRMVRTVIKQIGDAINTGMANAYEYSKIVGGDLAASFDKLSSASYAAKNQLGAAFATALQNITPLLLQLINLVTQAAQAVAQFFAVLGGSGTYLKANTDYMKSWGDETKKAGGAAKDLANAMLGIDELNVISQDTGGSGASAAGLDYEDMFDEMAVDPWALKIKETIDWLKENFGLVRDLALAIGAALLGWKLARGFTDDLLKLIGFAMAFAGAVLYVKGFIDAWNNGPDWKNLAEMITGLALAAVGLGIALGPVAAGIALVVGGIGLLVIGIKEWIENGELSTQAFLAVASGIAAVAVGIGLLTGSAGIALLVAGIGSLVAGLTDWISTGELSTKTFWLLEAGIVAVGAALALLISPWSLLVAAVAVVALAVYQYWDEIKSWTIETWGAVTDWLSEAWNNIKETAVTVWNAIGDFFTKTIPNIVNGIVTWFSELPEKIAYWVGFTLGKIVQWGIDAINWAKEEVPKIIENIVTFFEELPGKILVAILNVRDKIVEWKDNVIEAVTTEVPKIISEIMGFFEELPGKLLLLGVDIIQGLINGVTDAWENLKSGVSSIAGSFLQGFKDALGIHSPSKEFEQIGEYSIAGLEKGMKQTDTLVENFSKTMDQLTTRVDEFSSKSEEHVLRFTENSEEKLTEFADKWTELNKGILSEFEKCYEEVTNRIYNLALLVAGSIEAMRNRSISAINSITASLNAIPRSITTVHTIITKNITESSGGSSGGGSALIPVTARASGGFVDSGQLFLARESGPELVGTIGGKTGVASNDQIVAGISRGVTEANEEQNRLLEEQNSLLRAILAKTGVSIDGKTIKTAYDRANREAGASIMSGGVFA